MITYLYDYESGTKGKGTGFIRVDQRGRDVRMDVHVRDARHMEGKGKLYLVVGKDPVLGIYVGDVMVARGEGSGSFRFSAYNVCDSGMDFSDVLGVVIRNGTGYLASNWQEVSCPELLKGSFQTTEYQIQEKNSENASEYMGIQVANIDNETITDALLIPEENIVQTREITESEITDAQNSDAQILAATNSLSLEEADHHIDDTSDTEPFLPPPTYRKIQLSHIQNLPPQNRHLGNNNFLRHGFFNYNYLILKKEKTSDGELWSLGVPGVYEQPEKVLATMFGFPRFEAREEVGEILKDGTEGAWFTPLQM